MKTVQVSLPGRSYDILIGPGLLAEVPRLLSDRETTRRLFLVSNPTVHELYGERLMQGLADFGFRVSEILIPDGESHKTLRTVERIYGQLVTGGADRSSALLALGGGVTGDIAGFAAATFMRGIPYIQIPTTMVAQVDSSVGGKTGVNHGLAKNMVGSFWQPSLVCIDPETLLSLPQREYQSGLYEVFKYGLIRDAEFFDWLNGSLEEIQARNAPVMQQLIQRCCQIKAEVTAQDERESDLRRILNLGHTFGHGLESAVRFQGVTHGEAVAYGMMAAAHLSHWRTGLSPESRDRAVQSIREIGPLPTIDTVPTGRVVEAMKRDKKRRNQRTVVVLLAAIGITRIRDDIPDQDLARAWDQVKQVK